MPIENDKGPGGVDAAYGKRTTLPARSYDVTKRYGDTFREDGDGPVNHIIKEDENGNVGIGTAAPIYDLQVGEYGVSTDSTLALATTNTGTGTIRFGDGTSGPNANSGRIQYDHSTDNMNFWTNSSERMRIDSLGNVGIGTASPNRPLTINNSTSQVQFVNSTTGTGSSDGLTVGMGGAASADAYINQQENANLIFNTNATERIRIDSSGNVGLGTTNATSRLTVSGDVRTLAGGTLILNNPTNNAAGSIGFATGDNLVFYGGGSTERMRIDAAGNLGFSVTPSNWVGYKAFEFGPGNALWGSNTNSSFLSTNLYWDGAFKYKGAFPASYYQQSAGEHRWFTAPTGTANAAATTTQRMTLDVSGNLGLGVTPVSIGGTNATVHVHGVSGSNPNLRLTNADTGATASDGSAIFVGNAGGAGTGSLNLYNYESAPIAFYTATTERMRIDASGNVGVGTTNALKTLTVKGSGIAVQGATQNIGNSLRLYRADSVEMGYIGWSDESVANSAMLIKSSNGNPILFSINTSEYMRIDTSGNVLVTGSGGLGYGTGSGGTVTQLTSKSTAVTLNKSNGQIVMHNAALAAGASVSFTVNSDRCGQYDVAHVVYNSGASSASNYEVKVIYTTTNGFGVKVTNVSGGSLSEALVLNFVIIKGAIN